MSLPRIPVRFLKQNKELIKAQAGQQLGGTDYSEDVTVARVLPGVQQSYRTPADRECGNPLFRRYTDGTLDADYACQKIVDAIHMVRNSGSADVLGSIEKVSLSVLFPQSFMFVDSAMASHVAHVQLRLTEAEVQLLRMMVASHLAAEMNWNAGLGGGSVSGRTVTQS